MRDSLIGAYRRERRTMDISGFRREDLGVLVRYSPVNEDAAGFVCFASIPPGELQEEIGRQIAHFHQFGGEFEWKVHGADQPRGLREALVRAGFEEGEPEALMAYDVSQSRERPDRAAAGIEVRRMERQEELPFLLELQEAIWDRSFSWLHAHLLAIWDFTAFYGAWRGDRMVGSGWIEYPAGSRFAEIHGGAVLPEFRGQGIYSLLFESRVLDARARGVPWIAVDAAPMSRPILEAKGFLRLDSTWPLVWSGGSCKNPDRE